MRGRFCVACGQRDPHYVEEIHCENCGAPKQGLYCAVCGQNDRNYRRSAFPVVGQALAETFEADSRLWATLWALFARPGHLSAEFSRNRRASYLPPFRLYLFSSIVFFFALSMSIDLPDWPGPGAALRYGDGPAPAVRERLREQGILPDRPDPDTDTDADADDARRQGLLMRLDLDEDDLGLDGLDDIDGLRAARHTPTPQQRAAMDRFMEILDDERRRRLTRLLRGPVGQAAWEGVGSLAPEDIDNMGQVGRYVVGQVIDVVHDPWGTVQTWIENLPVAMFCVLPLYALLLKIVYPFRRFYAEHLVFAMHIHTVAFIMFTIPLLLPDAAAIDGWASPGLFLAFAVYQFLALRNYYGGGVLATVFKYGLLAFTYSLLLLAAMAAAFGVVFLLI